MRESTHLSLCDIKPQDLFWKESLKGTVNEPDISHLQDLSNTFT